MIFNEMFLLGFGIGVIVSGLMSIGIMLYQESEFEGEE
jgi:hypothetical protein